MKNVVKNVVSLFDGMSGGQLALNKAKIKYKNYFASEVDKYAISVTNVNYPKTKQLGDITKIKKKHLPKKVHLLLAGSPCQGFSTGGLRQGFDDGRSALFWEFVRIFKLTKPKYFLLENVVMKKEWQSIISKALGVEPVLINSRNFSAQDRKRLYWTNIPVSSIIDKGIILKDIIQKKVHSKYFLSEAAIAKIKRNRLKGYYANIKTKKARTLIAGYYKIPSDGIYFKDKKGRKRRYTPIECERLQTVPDNYTDICSDTQRYKMLGNGWNINTIAFILKNIK